MNEPKRNTIDQKARTRSERDIEQKKDKQTTTTETDESREE